MKFFGNYAKKEKKQNTDLEVHEEAEQNLEEKHLLSAEKQINGNNTYLFIAWWYSVAQGISTGFSTFYPMFQKTKNLILSIVAGATAGSADIAASRYFQGEVIVENSKDGKKDYGSFKSQPLGPPKKINTALSIGGQIAYTTLDLGKSSVGRIFLFFALFEILSQQGNDEEAELVNKTLYYSLLCLLVLGMVLKQLFNLTNEAFEVNQKIVKKTTGNSDALPYCQNGIMFKPLKNRIGLRIFKILGITDHVLQDDLLPLITLLPEKAIQYLAANMAARNLVLAIGGTVGIAISILVFYQTYLFEGHHTDENVEQVLESIYKDLPKKDLPENKLNISPWLAKTLRHTLWLMSILHGVSAAASSFYSLRQLIENPYAREAASWGTGIATFIGTFLGHQKSECKEAIMQLDKILVQTPASELIQKPTLEIN